MNNELTQKLFEKYPLLYADKNKSARETMMCYGLSCDDGWFDVIDRLSEKLEALIKQHIAANGIEDHPRAAQVKEKFGTMRFYMTSYSEEIEKVISEAEAEASNICEACGKPGELYTSGFWLKTLCQESADVENAKEDLISKFIKHEDWISLVKEVEKKET